MQRVVLEYYQEQNESIDQGAQMVSSSQSLVTVFVVDDLEHSSR